MYVYTRTYSISNRYLNLISILISRLTFIWIIRFYSSNCEKADMHINLQMTFVCNHTLETVFHILINPSLITFSKIWILIFPWYRWILHYQMVHGTELLFPVGHPQVRSVSIMTKNYFSNLFIKTGLKQA